MNNTAAPDAVRELAAKLFPAFPGPTWDEAAEVIREALAPLLQKARATQKSSDMRLALEFDAELARWETKS